MKKPHKHAEVIKAWADGEEIQVKAEGRSIWEDCDENRPAWLEYNEYRVKPREFPKSSLPYQTLCEIWNAQLNVPCNEGTATRALRVCADMAVKQYIMDLEKEAAQRILRGEGDGC